MVAIATVSSICAKLSTSASSKFFELALTKESWLLTIQYNAEVIRQTYVYLALRRAGPRLDDMKLWADIEHLLDRKSRFR